MRLVGRAESGQRGQPERESAGKEAEEGPRAVTPSGPSQALPGTRLSRVFDKVSPS